MFKKIKSAFLNYAADQAGAILPAAAVMMLVILGAAGLGVDVGMWNLNQRNLQTAADAAAISGAWEIQSGNEDNVDDAALKEAIANGYIDIAGNNLDIEIGENDDGETTVKATVTQKGQKYLSSFIFQNDIMIATTATAAILLVPGDFCMLSLDPTASGSLLFNGNITVNSLGCGLAVNSNHPTAALNVNGNSANINVGDVSVVGGIDGEQVINSPSIKTGVSPFADPYSDLTIPAGNGCTTAQVNAGPARPSSIPAANAEGVRKLCGGLLVKNNETLNLPAGVYIVDGGDVDIKGVVTGTGVTLILTKTGSAGTYGNMNVSGQLTMSAPLPGDLDPAWSDYEGLAIYQDRNATSSATCNDVRGNAAVVVSGTMYFPSRCLDIGGTPSTSGAPICSRIIATTIKLHGNPNMDNACEGTGARDIEASGKVRLIL